MSWIKRLQDKWGLKTVTQVILVLVVFSCTGFSVLFLKTPIISLLTGDGERTGWTTFFYYLMILPIYNVLLLCYGFLFGQFEFFWAYEKRMIGRFKRKKSDPQSESSN